MQKGLRKATSGEPSLGERIQDLCDTCGFNQRELAEKVGVTQSAVSGWLRDDPDRHPSAEMMIKLGSLHPDPAKGMWFLEEAGLRPEVILSAARHISRGLATERIIEAPEGMVVVVKHLHQYPEVVRREYYVDAGAVKDPIRLVYIDSILMPSSSPDRGERCVVIIDQSPSFNEVFGENVVVDISGRVARNPIPLSPGKHIGRFSLRVLGDSCMVFFENIGYRRPEEEAVQPVAVYTPQLEDGEREVLSSEEFDDRYREVQKVVRDREMKRCPLPDGVEFIGRAVMWFKPDENG